MEDQLSKTQERSLIDAAEAQEFTSTSSFQGLPARQDTRVLDELPPEAFGGYEIVREFHRGGQGVVYEAVQKHTQRRVAIKVLLEGPFASQRDRARFEREIQVLGQLRHPNIVNIHHAGQTHGCFYFVMGFAPGEPVDVFVQQRHLSINDTLRLFGKISSAVQAVHVKGITHRDLKPSNIRVDSHGEPRVLDFGLAKVEPEHEATQWRNMTMTGQFVGSLPWASPEQADGIPDRVDLRTDVYSLGVMLYQALTGRFPYPIVPNMRESLTHILETEPTRPSTIRRQIDEDVETIVLKCLAKEPQRRYQSAAALAEDIERYLAHQPIAARSPSTIYQLKKLVLRNKLPAMFVTALFVLAAGSSIWMSVLYTRAKSAERQQDERRVEAEREAAAAKAIKDFLVSDLIASAKPENALGREVTVAEVMANASERIDTAFEHQPLIEAAVRSTLGQVYLSLGIFDAAETHLRAAERTWQRELGELHQNTLRDRVALIEALGRQDKLEEAGAMADPTYESARRVLGEQHEITILAAAHCARFHWLNGRFQEARELYDRTLDTARRALGDQHATTVNLLNGRATWAEFVAQAVDEETLFDEAFATSRGTVGDEHPQTLLAMANLGSTLWGKRRFDEAEALLRASLKGRMQILGPDHADTIESMIKLAQVLREKGLLDETESLLRDAGARMRRSLGEDHSSTLYAYQMIGNTLMRHGYPADAIPIFRRNLDNRLRNDGDDHLRSANVMTELCIAFQRLGRYRDAETVCRRAFEIDRRARWRGDQITTGSLRHFAKCLAAQGKVNELRPLAIELLERRRRAVNDDPTDAYKLNCLARALVSIEPVDLRDPQSGLEAALRAYDHCTDAYHYNRYTLALAYEANGDNDRAIAMVERALKHIPIEASTERSEYETALVRFLEGVDQSEAAEQVYRDTLASRREHFEENHSDIAASLFDLANLLLTNGEHIEAEKYLRECLDMREALLTTPGADTYRLTLTCDTVRTRVALARSLVGQGRFADAELLLLNAYEEFGQASYCHAAFLPDTLRRLITLYEAWDRETAAGEFRNILAQTCLSQECYP